MTKHRREQDAVRPIGFYVVFGTTTVAGDGEQPAYWDGVSWWMIGWASRVPSLGIRVIRAIEVKQ